MLLPLSFILHVFMLLCELLLHAVRSILNRIFVPMLKFHNEYVTDKMAPVKIIISKANHVKLRGLLRM